MEVKNGDQFTKTVLLAEFLGTTGFMLGINLGSGPITLYLFAMLTGGISGGHLNPAVTIGVYFERK